MNDDASSQEEFDDLTRLSQAGRLRYMKGLSREVLIKVLALSLHTVASSGWDERARADTTANRDVDATGGAQQRKRSHEPSSTTLHVEKKPRTQEPAPQIQEHEYSEDNAVMKVEADVIEDVIISGVAPVPTTPTTARIPHPPIPFSMVVSIPGQDSGATLTDISHLPVYVRTELQHRIYEACNSSNHRRDRYRGMQGKPENRLNKGMCIRCQFIEVGRTSKRPQGYYTQGGESKRSADDLCIERRSPCVYMARPNEICTLCIVPLPAGLRVGKKWDELEYWVTSGEFAP